MPDQVIFGVVVESVLVTMTTVLLVQPEWLIRIKPGKLRGMMGTAGFFFLCATFCWSVVVGAILVLNQMTIRI